MSGGSCNTTTQTFSVSGWDLRSSGGAVSYRVFSGATSCASSALAATSLSVTAAADGLTATVTVSPPSTAVLSPSVICRSLDSGSTFTTTGMQLLVNVGCLSSPLTALLVDTSNAACASSTQTLTFAGASLLPTYSYAVRASNQCVSPAGTAVAIANVATAASNDSVTMDMAAADGALTVSSSGFLCARVTGSSGVYAWTGITVQSDATCIGTFTTDNTFSLIPLAGCSITALQFVPVMVATNLRASDASNVLYNVFTDANCTTGNLFAPSISGSGTITSSTAGTLAFDVGANAVAVATPLFLCAKVANSNYAPTGGTLTLFGTCIAPVTPATIQLYQGQRLSFVLPVKNISASAAPSPVVFTYSVAGFATANAVLQTATLSGGAAGSCTADVATDVAGTCSITSTMAANSQVDLTLSFQLNLQAKNGGSTLSLIMTAITVTKAFNVLRAPGAKRVTNLTFSRLLCAPHTLSPCHGVQFCRRQRSTRSSCNRFSARTSAQTRRMSPSTAASSSPLQPFPVSVTACSPMAPARRCKQRCH